MWKGRAVPLLALLAGLVPALARAAEPSYVSFYECLRCSSPPAIDGKLDDVCWRNLPVTTDFYRYWSQMPEPAPLKTAAMLAYDDRGLYMGITLYEERLDKIRATVRNRDDPETWRDDCVEIMIDPHNSGTGYFKFTTNFLGARYDEKVVNMAFDASGWNATGWRVGTSKDESAWYIEFAMPWGDIGVKPRQGDIWSFDLVRYGYSTGGFRGVSWSVGGSYASPQDFGYLGFGRFFPAGEEALQQIARTVSRTKGDNFCLLLPELVLTHEPSGNWKRQELRAWVAEPLGEAAQLLSRAEEGIQEISMPKERNRLQIGVKQVRARLKEEQDSLAGLDALSPSAACVARQRGLALGSDAEGLKWDAMLMALISSQ